MDRARPRAHLSYKQERPRTGAVQMPRHPQHNANREPFIKPIFAILIAATAFLAPHSAHAQSWPDRPIKLIVPQPPGGGFDTVARILADRMGPLLGQRVVVENRTGAGTLVGTGAAVYYSRNRRIGFEGRLRRCSWTRRNRRSDSAT